MSTIYFRQSEIKKFKRCPRSWWLSYKRDGNGYVLPTSGEALSGQRDVGTLVHSGLEAYYKHGTSPSAYIAELRLRLLIELNIPELSKELQEAFTLAQIMVQGYMQWLEEQGSDANEEVLHVEHQIEVPIGRIRGEDIVLTGHVDLITQDRSTGEVIISDHKTVQSLDQVGQQLQVDDQGLLYAMLVQAGLSLPVRRFRHNMLRKVKRTKTATPPFYGRHEVGFNEEQLDNAWTHTAIVLDKMVECLQRLADSERYHHITVYPNPTKDCTWDCDHLHSCVMMDDGSDWKGMYATSGLYVRRQEREMPSVPETTTA